MVDMIQRIYDGGYDPSAQSEESKSEQVRQCMDLSEQVRQCMDLSEQVRQCMDLSEKVRQCMVSALTTAYGR
jgi:hypothetical protein